MRIPKNSWLTGAHSDSLASSCLALSIFFTGVVLSASNLSWRTDSFRVNPFGRDSDEEEPRDKSALSQQVKRNHDAVCWVEISRVKDQGLQFWQTKSQAIIVHNLVPADCIYRVISQKRRSNTVQKTLNPTTRAESHTEKQLAFAAAAVSL